MKRNTIQPRRLIGMAILSCWAGLWPAAVAAEALTPLDVRQVKIGGEIGRRIDMTVTNNLLMLDVDKDFLRPFQKKNRTDGYVGLGKTIEAAVRFAAYTKSGEPLALKRRLVEETVKTQEPDGYIGIMDKDARMWRMWDVHEMGYIILGLAGDHRSNDMLARVDRDVLSKKPTLMTLSCGVNDVAHGKNGVPLEDYKKNIAALVDKVQAAGVKPVILTSTMIGEDQGNGNNRKLAAYNEFLQTLARDRKLPLADLNAQMQEAVKRAKAANAPKPNRSNYLTSDGVHMAPEGDQMMAEGVLRVLGLDEAQVAKAKAAWLEIPAAIPLKTAVTVSLKDYNRLAAAAAKEGLPANEYAEREMAKALNAVLTK